MEARSPFVEALSKLLQCNVSIKKAYSLIKITKEVDEQLKIFNEAKNGLIMKHGTKWEDGKFRASGDEFLKEFAELLSIEFTIDTEQIDLSNENISIPTIYLMELKWLIKMDEESEPKTPTE